MLTHHQWGSVAVTREQFYRTAASVQSTVLYNYIENHAFKIISIPPKGEWVKYFLQEIFIVFIYHDKLVESLWNGESMITSYNVVYIPAIRLIQLLVGLDLILPKSHKW